MKKFKNYFFLGASLVCISAAIYIVQLCIFHDAHTTFFYMLQDLAFLPISMLLVTFTLEQLMASREKKSKLDKMNMVIGAFYSEVGTKLIKYCVKFDKDFKVNKCKLHFSNNWTNRDFDQAAKLIKNHTFRMDLKLFSIEELKDFLVMKRDFLLNLLGNPVLLEHDAFTDLLWSIFHISDEFLFRKTLNNLSDEDYAHLSMDLERVYSLLLCEWLFYVKHIKTNYPYLFSLSLRENPFMQ